MEGAWERLKVFYLDEEVLFEQVTVETYGREGAHPVKIRGRVLALSRRDSKCKSHEPEMCFFCSSDIMKAIVAGTCEQI